MIPPSFNQTTQSTQLVFLSTPSLPPSSPTLILLSSTNYILYIPIKQGEKPPIRGETNPSNSIHRHQHSIGSNIIAVFSMTMIVQIEGSFIIIIIPYYHSLLIDIYIYIPMSIYINVGSRSPIIAAPKKETQEKGFA